MTLARLAANAKGSALRSSGAWVHAVCRELQSFNITSSILTKQIKDYVIKQYSSMRAAHVLAGASLSLPPDSYIYTILETDDRASNLAAISSDDSLRVFHPETLQLVSGGQFKKVHEGVTCVRTLNDNGRTLATAGRDGLLHGWDERTGQRVFSLKDGAEQSYLQSKHTWSEESAETRPQEPIRLTWLLTAARTTLL